jgi:hypothetical protein
MTPSIRRRDAMAKRVAIDSITTDRVLVPGDDLTELIASIKEVGVEIPPLVSQDYELIDGLRRIEALRSLGETEVVVVPTFLYPRACEQIKQAHEHGVASLPLTPQRIWEIYTSMQPLLTVTKAHNQRNAPKKQGVRPTAGGRALLSRALRFRSDGELQALVYVFRALADPAREKRAGEAIALLSEGQITYYGASEYVRKTTGFTGDIIALNQQQEALESAIASINGTVGALGRLGPLNRKFTKGEAETRLSELLLVRNKLSHVIKLLTEEINEK